MRKYKYLNKKNAIKITIELWTWLKKTGSKDKEDWPGWKKIKKEYGRGFVYDCPLCEHGRQRERILRRCLACPYFIKQGYECYLPIGYISHKKKPRPYDNWKESFREENRKKYAGQFLDQIKELE